MKIVGTFYCPFCKEVTNVYEEDCGIGSYEFWGQKCTDTRIGYFCEKCDDPADGFEPDDFGDQVDEAYERERDRRLEEAWEKEQADPKERERY